jgi:hypothetical protein
VSIKFSYESFSRDVFASLDESARQGRLKALEGEIRPFLIAADSFVDFFTRTYQVADALARCGHELGLWDYDGTSREEWGWNYMKSLDAQDTKGKLFCVFTYPDSVELEWCPHE